MIEKLLLLSVVCSVVRSSEIAVGAPVVAAASSQYFERNFNRLVVGPALEPANPVAPAPPVLVQPLPAPVQPTEQIQPSVAIAVATAHAAAPVSTILLPPYPFGLPPGFGFIQPINVPDEDRKEATTKPTTTEKEPEQTTQIPLPSNNDNSFAQALPFPSNQNGQFSQYIPPPLPKPQKLRTTVEIVPVPLTYIAPPPVRLEPINAVKHIHAFVPTKARIIIRPIRTRTIRVPARIVRISPNSRVSAPRYRQNIERVPNNGRDVEPTTFRPFNRPNTKPPRF